MISPADSLLRYDSPGLVSTSSGLKSAKGRTLKVSPQQTPDTTPVPPPPRPKPGSNEQPNEILNAIFPPREWTEGTQLWVQRVSTAPCTRTGVVQLSEQLDTKLQQRQARLTGICPVRRELYSQCFDELIRQVTINCAERGLLLSRVRNENQMTTAAYQTLYESSMAFGMRKALRSEQDKVDMNNRITDLENEKQDLIKQLNEEKAKCDNAIEKWEAERREVVKKRSEEIQDLKRMKQLLKTELEMIITSKK